jgi:hypothetical protein
VPKLVPLVVSLTCAAIAASAATGALPRPHGCTTLKVIDVQRVSKLEVLSRPLAPPPTDRVQCATMFYGGVGDIVVVIMQRVGGAQTLSRVRATSAGQDGATALQPDAAFGPAAFVAHQRVLAFRHGRWVITLETGYSSTGHQPVLSVAQLERLARIVTKRL